MCSGRGQYQAKRAISDGVDDRDAGSLVVAEETSRMRS
jgi:hypothetical protein